MAIPFSVDLHSAWLDYAIVNRELNSVIAVDFFDRSVTKIRSMNARLNSSSCNIGGECFNTMSVVNGNIELIPFGRDQICNCLSVKKDAINDKYLFTTDETVLDDFYDYLMRKFRLPLLKDWMPYILKEGKKKKGPNGRKIVVCLEDMVICDNPQRAVMLQQKNIFLSELKLYELAFNDENLKEIVSSGLKENHIKICDTPQKPLVFKGLDEYFQMYASSILSNIDNEIKPYLPIEGEINDMAFISKRLFPQQAACLNGIVELLQHQDYALYNEGMGCGKTIQGIGTVELYHIKKYMIQHPERTIEEIYNDSAAIRYRAIVMAPSHLVYKWKEEIESEIIYADVKVLSKFEDVIELQRQGKKPCGKEWYIMSKEFAKLGDQQAPIPSMVKLKSPSLKVCADCEKEQVMVIASTEDKKCKRCGGIKWKRRYADYKVKGLICPYCGELLLNCTLTGPTSKIDSMDSLVLSPQHFDARRESNSRCYHCGAVLWGSEVKKLDGGFFEHLSKRKTVWEKISYKPRKSSKTKKTAWIMRKFLSEWICEKKLSAKDIVNISSAEGDRKYPPISYMKKYCKGYFDFAILDEAHKYENGGTAQTHAAHILKKISRKTVCMTGTISNGYAKNLFYLFWILCPYKLREKGYTYADVTKFSKTYGTVVSEYDYNGSEVEEYNSASRGRQIKSPTASPGISPLLYVEFLLGSGVQLDLEDLSNYLPKLKEEIVLVDLEPELKESYNEGITTLKQVVHSEEGKSVLSKMLRYSLFYTDKPYKREPIMSSYIDDKVLYRPKDHIELIETGGLLNKERKLIELVRQEIKEKRNMFIFCECTGDVEAYIPERLKDILEKHVPVLRGKVRILEAGKPSASKREDYMHSQSEKGVKVFICNPALVETGLDFIWKSKEGVIRNYPTIIFYQLTYNLSTLWQASRRHYRLIQKEECRTFYMASIGTTQVDALKLMGEKQTAVSAIQGKFSSGGLSAMARGVDARLILAQKLQKSQPEEVDTDSLNTMFSELNERNNSVDKRFIGFKPMRLLNEIVNEKVYVSGGFMPDEIFNNTSSDLDVVADAQYVEISSSEDIDYNVGFIDPFSEVSEENGDISIFDFNEPLNITKEKNSVKTKKKKKKNNKDVQMSIFDLICN